MKTPPVSTEKVAEMEGVHPTQIIRWYKSGAIPAETAEGKLYRFDPEKVRAALAARAEERRKKKATDPAPISARRVLTK